MRYLGGRHPDLAPGVRSNAIARLKGQRMRLSKTSYYADFYIYATVMVTATVSA